VGQGVDFYREGKDEGFTRRGRGGAGVLQ
jgi:hypothetical protein